MLSIHLDVERLQATTNLLQSITWASPYHMASSTKSAFVDFSGKLNHPPKKPYNSQRENDSPKVNGPYLNHNIYDNNNKCIDSSQN